jgi:hypothetical protein
VNRIGDGSIRHDCTTQSLRLLKWLVHFVRMLCKIIKCYIYVAKCYMLCYKAVSYLFFTLGNSCLARSKDYIMQNVFHYHAQISAFCLCSAASCLLLSACLSFVVFLPFLFRLVSLLLSCSPLCCFATLPFYTTNKYSMLPCLSLIADFAFCLAASAALPYSSSNNALLP